MTGIRIATSGSVLAVVASITMGCGPTDEGVREGDAGSDRVADPSPVVVYTVNYPLAYFAEQIGGAHVDVRFPAPPDVDPALWSPAAETVAEYQTADLVLLSGAGYAAWTDRVSLPPSSLLDTSAGERVRYVPVLDGVTHAHGPEGEHSHDEKAYTIWLDQTIAFSQATAIRDALTRLRPDWSAEFNSGYDSLLAGLNDLDARLRRIGGDALGVPLLASHPVYQYLASAYGLDLRSVHFEPGEPPDERAWDELVALLEDRPASLMLWEAEPLGETAERLGHLGVRIAVFNPAANRPATGDYLDVMETNVATLEDLVATP